MPILQLGVNTHACMPAHRSVIDCSNLPLVSEVARSLDFAPALHELANQIISRLTKDGQLSYNAAHLRIEKDARDWSIIMGGDGVSQSNTGFLLTQLLYISEHERNQNFKMRMCTLTAGQVIWHLYKQAMREAKFNSSTPLYIASGLLTYGANEGAFQHS
jgi:hypothetical protein